MEDPARVLEGVSGFKGLGLGVLGFSRFHFGLRSTSLTLRAQHARKSEREGERGFKKLDVRCSPCSKIKRRKPDAQNSQPQAVKPTRKSNTPALSGQVGANPQSLTLKPKPSRSMNGLGKP